MQEYALRRCRRAAAVPTVRASPPTWLSDPLATAATDPDFDGFVGLLDHGAAACSPAHAAPPAQRRQ